MNGIDTIAERIVQLVESIVHPAEMIVQVQPSNPTQWTIAPDCGVSALAPRVSRPDTPPSASC